MNAKYAVLTGIALFATCGTVHAQEREDRTLLTQQQMTAIINEVSGERAMHHVLDLVPYQFVRPPAEYKGPFREAEAMARMAKEYGFKNVTIEDYPTGQTYQPTVGELWTTGPIRDFLSGEFTPLPLADLMAVLKAREAAGAVKLITKTEEPAAKAGKK